MPYSLRLGLVVLLALACVLAQLFLPRVLSESSSWVLLSPRTSSSVVLFDVDGDGYADYAGLDGYLVSEGLRITETTATYAKASIEGYELCFVEYYASRGLLRAYCGRSVYEFAVPVNETLRVFSSGLVVGDTLVARGKAYVASILRSSVVVCVDGELVAIGVEGGVLKLYYPEHKYSEVIARLNLTLLAATYSAEQKSIYIIASSGFTTLLLEYSVEYKVLSQRTLGLPGIPLKAFSTKSSLYLLSSTRVLYRVLFNGTLERIADGVRDVFYPADSPDSFTALRYTSVLKVSDAGGEVVVREYPLPEAGDVYAADWCGLTIAVATSRGVYATIEDTVEVRVEAPEFVYAGEEVVVKASGNYKRLYLLLGNREYSSERELVISEVLPPGVHSLKVHACKGIYCTTVERSINVLLRPLKVLVEHPSEAKPHQLVNITVVAVDVLTGRAVDASCTLRDPRGLVNIAFTSGKLVEVPAVPLADNSVLNVTCSTLHHAPSSTLVELRLTEPYLALNATEVAPGVLRISGYDKYTGEAWWGLVVVELGGEVRSNPGYVDVKPSHGFNVLKVRFVYNNTVVYAAELSLYYFEATTTITRILPVEVPREVERLNPLLLVAVAALSSGATYALLVLLRRGWSTQRV